MSSPPEGCCALGEEDFRRCCRLLLQRSKQLRDGWSWEPVQGSEEGYLRKTAVRSVFIGPKASDSDCGPDQQGAEQQESAPTAPADADHLSRVTEDEDDPDDPDDGVCVVSGGSSQVLQYEYHILHSCSYAAPVLYFRAFTQVFSGDAPPSWSLRVRGEEPFTGGDVELRPSQLPAAASEQPPKHHQSAGASSAGSALLHAPPLQDRGGHEAPAAGSSPTTQTGELRAVVAQCCGSCGGPGRPSEVLHPAQCCSLAGRRRRQQQQRPRLRPRVSPWITRRHRVVGMNLPWWLLDKITQKAGLMRDSGVVCVFGESPSVKKDSSTYWMFMVQV
ncbi:ubiquitin-like-conjugating enzyme ATG10 isoform 2-T2 [Spinachia spinachia]